MNKPSLYSHDIGHHSTTGGNEHDISLDGVVITDEALHGQVNQHSCYQPDGENRQQCTQDLCINKKQGERQDLQSCTLLETKKTCKLLKLQYVVREDDWIKVHAIRPDLDGTTET